jgi:hypothetical protein
LDRIEELLTVFGFSTSCTIEAITKSSIAELYKVRHLVVHNGGRLDERILSELSVDASLHDMHRVIPIKISSDDIDKYSNAIITYAKDMWQRVWTHFEIDKNPLPTEWMTKV